MTPVGRPFPEDPDQPLFDGLAWRYSHPYFGAACSAGRALRRASDKPLVPGPYVGEHSAEVLRMLGYDEATIAHLFEAGVVASPYHPGNPPHLRGRGRRGQTMPYYCLIRYVERGHDAFNRNPGRV